jgi:hypothetical protein
MRTSTASSRIRPRHDLHLRARPRRSGHGREHLSRRHVHRRVPEYQRRTRPGCSACSLQFSFPGGIPSHVAPETPGSIHEGGELGYSLSARLRRGVRQSRPDRRLRRRRRRGRDRARSPRVALEQVPQSRARRRGAADSAPQRLQDRQPDVLARISTTSSSSSSAAMAGSRASSRATTRRDARQLMAETLDEGHRRDPRIQQHARTAHDSHRARAGR